MKHSTPLLFMVAFFNTITGLNVLEHKQTEIINQHIVAINIYLGTAQLLGENNSKETDDIINHVLVEKPEKPTCPNFLEPLHQAVKNHSMLGIPSIHQQALDHYNRLHQTAINAARELLVICLQQPHTCKKIYHKDQTFPDTRLAQKRFWEQFDAILTKRLHDLELQSF